MTSKVATLMAVYFGDDPSLLKRALESTLQQKFRTFVDHRLYLLVNGQVPTTIHAVLDEYKERIHHIGHHSVNLGLACALNTLIASLEDEAYVFRMDADDASHEDRYQKQLDYLEDHPDIDIVGTDIVEVDMPSGHKRQVRFSLNPEDAIRSLCKRVPVAHPTVCFRRHVLDVVKAYPDRGSNEDIALWFICAKQGYRFGNVHLPLLEFTVSRNFWNRRSAKKSYSEFRCYVQGIWLLHGITWRYIFPVMRLGLRLAPRQVSQFFYNSSIRTSLK